MAIIRAAHKFLTNRPTPKGRKVVRLDPQIFFTHGPCTMPSWAGTSGWSDEDIAWLDALEAEERGEGIQLPLFEEPAPADR